MSQRALELLRERQPAGIIDAGSHLGDEMALVERDHLLEVMRTARDDPDLEFNMLSDLTVVDYLGDVPRFEVVYHLYSLRHRHRIRIKVPVVDAAPERCWVDSVTSLWKSANWSEREAYDMYGLGFRGHPDLRRILMYDEFEGHPLRKDYPANRRQPLIRRPDAPQTDDLTTRLQQDSHDRRVE